MLSLPVKVVKLSRVRPVTKWATPILLVNRTWQRRGADPRGAKSPRAHGRCNCSWQLITRLQV